MLEPDVEEPRDLRGRHVQARKFEKRIAEAEGIEIDRTGKCDHGQTPFQRLPNYRGNGSHIVALVRLFSAQLLRLMQIRATKCNPRRVLAVVIALASSTVPER